MIVAGKYIWTSEDWKTEPPTGKPKLTATAWPNRTISFCLQTSDFEIEYKDGKAQVSLSRDLTFAQVRQFAETLLAATDRVQQDEIDFTRLDPNSMGYMKKGM